VALDPVELKALALELAAAMPPLPSSAEIDFRPVDVSPRAKKMRAIMRIADAYGWHSAIVHYLETKGVPYLSDLTNTQLEDLLDRMDGYVDAAETGCSLEHGLPAF
jgi:hypothetical protein